MYTEERKRPEKIPLGQLAPSIRFGCGPEIVVIGQAQPRVCVVGAQVVRCRWGVEQQSSPRTAAWVLLNGFKMHTAGVMLCDSLHVPSTPSGPRATKGLARSPIRELGMLLRGTGTLVPGSWPNTLYNLEHQSCMSLNMSW